MITGKRPTDASFTEGLNLHKYVSSRLPDHVKDVVSLSMFHSDFDTTETAAVMQL